MQLFKTEAAAFAAAGAKLNALALENKDAGFRVLKAGPDDYKVLILPEYGFDTRNPFYLGSDENQIITTPIDAIAYLRHACHRSARGTCYGTCHARGTDAKASCPSIEIADIITALSGTKG